MGDGLGDGDGDGDGGAEGDGEGEACGDGDGEEDGVGFAVGDGEGGAGSDRKLGSGLGGGLGGVGVATERNRKRASPLTTKAVGTASMSAPRPGRAPVLCAEFRYARRRGVMWMPSAAAPAHAALA